jgi:hypothetical protein
LKLDELNQTDRFYIKLHGKPVGLSKLPLDVLQMEKDKVSITHPDSPLLEAIIKELEKRHEANR